jgi:hypothetical protein
MDPVSFDAFTRRASLVAAGVAGLTAFANPIAADGKKKKRKKNGDVNKLCKPQVAQCEAAFDLPNAQACCAILGTCDIAGFFDCLRSDV